MPIRSTTWRHILPAKPQSRRYNSKSLLRVQEALPRVRAALIARPHTFHQLFVKFPGLFETELRMCLHKLSPDRAGRYYSLPCQL